MKHRRRRRASRRARPRRRNAASCAASATRPTSRPAASRHRTSPARWRARGTVRGRRGARQSRPVASPCSPARTAMDRVTRRRSRRWSRAGSAFPIENVEIVHGDTGRIPFGMGTYGSRSLAVGGTAIIKALDKVIAKGKKIAAHLLEAAEADIEFKDGKFTVAGTDRSKAFARSRARRPTCRTTTRSTSWSRGSTRRRSTTPPTSRSPPARTSAKSKSTRRRASSTVVNFAACDDFGNIINPMIVEGQVHGGLAQGIGQALLERCVYDKDSGQLLTGSYMDYAMPRADDLPDVQGRHQGHAVHAQSARRQGLRRSRRYRLAAGADERGTRRAGGGRRQIHRHAGVAASRVAGDPVGEALSGRDEHVRIRISAGEIGRRRGCLRSPRAAARRSPVDRASLAR